METFKLSAPVTVGERTINELTFADPKVKHIMAVDGHDENSTAASVALVASLTAESELIIENLPPQDWRVIQPKARDIYLSFFRAPAAAEEKRDPPAATEPEKS